MTKPTAVAIVLSAAVLAACTAEGPAPSAPSAPAAPAAPAAPSAPAAPTAPEAPKAPAAPAAAEETTVELNVTGMT